MKSAHTVYYDDTPVKYQLNGRDQQTFDGKMNKIQLSPF